MPPGEPRTVEVFSEWPARVRLKRIANFSAVLRREMPALVPSLADDLEFRVAEGLQSVELFQQVGPRGLRRLERDELRSAADSLQGIYA